MALGAYMKWNSGIVCNLEPDYTENLPSEAIKEEIMARARQREALICVI